METANLNSPLAACAGVAPRQSGFLEVPVRRKRTNNPGGRLAAERGWGGKAPYYVTGENASLDAGLFNDIDVKKVYLREKPVHRRMQNLALSGFKTNEIAVLTGYSPFTVSQVLRQPFARNNMIQDMKKTVTEEINDFLAAEVMPILKEVREMSVDPLVAAPIKLACKQELLNRFLGRPTQPILSSEAKDPAAMSDEELASRVSKTMANLDPNPTTNGNGAPRDNGVSNSAIS